MYVYVYIYIYSYIYNIVKLFKQPTIFLNSTCIGIQVTCNYHEPMRQQVGKHLACIAKGICMAVYRFRCSTRIKPDRNCHFSAPHARAPSSRLESLDQLGENWISSKLKHPVSLQLYWRPSWIKHEHLHRHDPLENSPKSAFTRWAHIPVDAA